jgi:hypothetical protein
MRPPRPLPSLLGLALAGSARAAEHTIARATEPSSIGPIFTRTGGDQITAEHIFDRLGVRGPAGEARLEGLTPSDYPRVGRPHESFAIS